MVYSLARYWISSAALFLKYMSRAALLSFKLRVIFISNMFCFILNAKIILILAISKLFFRFSAEIANFVGNFKKTR